MATLAIINLNTNICENVVIDDRPINEIQFAEPYFAVDLDVTATIRWNLDIETNSWVQSEVFGSGGIGYAWDGTKLIQPSPIAL